MMRIGRLNRRVQLQSATEARDAHGQPVKTWTNQRTVWASVYPIRGKELMQAGQLTSTSMLRVLIRYEPQITADWRVVYGDRTLEIESVVDIGERHTMQELTCRETT